MKPAAARWVLAFGLPLGLADLAILNFELAPRLLPQVREVAAPAPEEVAFAEPVAPAPEAPIAAAPAGAEPVGQEPAPAAMPETEPAPIEVAAAQPPPMKEVELAPAPVDAEPVAEVKLPKLPIIYFYDGSSRLTPAATRRLVQATEHLAQHPTLKIQVRGHSDQRGDEGRNIALSQSRADVAMEWLRTHGVDAERMTLEAVGETEPAATGSDVDSMALNRRVELRWMP